MIEKNLSRGIQWLRAVQRISRPLAFSLLDALAATTGVRTRPGQRAGDYASNVNQTGQ